MTGVERIATALNERFLLDFPAEAARHLEALPPAEAVALLAGQALPAIVSVWELLARDVAALVLVHLAADTAKQVLTEADPVVSIAALMQLEPEERERQLKSLEPRVARELADLLAYPESAAGRIMDPRVGSLRGDLTVADATERLRSLRRRGLRELFVVDDEQRLVGRIEVEDLILARQDAPIREITRGIIATVGDLDPQDDVAETLQRHPVSVLPVINQSGRFMGVIRQAELVAAVRNESSLDLQTMVGASADERALSPASFAVRKRLPWLQINLLTAFLAAAVVGSFESIIAKFTALAVLLPVVAGQSGNAGAQALAVTMRGLVLKEISLRQWPRVVGKEAVTGLINGIGIAATTALGVYIWSRSLGLVVIIVVAMIISMIAAGLAGALVPILLRRFGQDPATASSIILTTVTDVVGFSSFLGIATLLAATLEPAL